MRLVKCGSHSLNTLTVSELAAVSDRAWQLRRDATIQMLDEAQVGDEIRVREMKAIYDIRGTRLPAITYALTIEGSIDIIKTACKVQGISHAAVTDGLTADELVSVAAQLVGHDPDAVKEQDSGE